MQPRIYVYEAFSVHDDSNVRQPKISFGQHCFTLLGPLPENPQSTKIRIRIWIWVWAKIETRDGRPDERRSVVDGQPSIDSQDGKPHAVDHGRQVKKGEEPKTEYRGTRRLRTWQKENEKTIGNALSRRESTSIERERVSITTHLSKMDKVLLARYSLASPERHLLTQGKATREISAFWWT